MTPQTSGHEEAAWHHAASLLFAKFSVSTETSVNLSVHASRDGFVGTACPQGTGAVRDLLVMDSGQPLTHPQRGWHILTEVNRSEEPGEVEVLRTEKPWGYELLWARTNHYAAKFLHVNEDHSLSLQVHEYKHETMCVIAGLVRLEIQNDGQSSVVILSPGRSYHIPAGTVHRLSAIVDSDVVETSTPELDDVVRLDDNYGRVTNRVAKPECAGSLSSSPT